MTHRALPLLALLPLSGCLSSGAPAPPALDVEVVFESDTKLGGCALGDIYPDRPGLEICVVTGAGELHVISRAAGLWVCETPLTSPGELIQVAVGDLVPDRPGDEILAGGMKAGTEDDPGPGMLWVSGRTRKGKWYAEPVFEPTALVHAVWVEDFDPSTRGLEAYSAGFDHLLHRVEVGREFPGELEWIAALDAPAKGICRHLGGLVVPLADGQLAWVSPVESGTDARSLFTASSGLARVASLGDELVVSSNDGTFWHVRFDGIGEAVPTPIYTDPDGAKGRGAVFANLGGVTGPIPVTAGYSGRIVALRPAGDGTYEPIVLHEEGAALHHLSAGDVLPEVPGDELVTVGYSGRVLLVKRAD